MYSTPTSVPVRTARSSASVSRSSSSVRFGMPGERVVQRLVMDRLFRLRPFDGTADHLRDRLQERQLVGREDRWFAGEREHDTPGAIGQPDHEPGPAVHALAGRRRGGEPGVLAKSSVTIEGRRRARRRVRVPGDAAEPHADVGRRPLAANRAHERLVVVEHLDDRRHRHARTIAATLSIAARSRSSTAAAAERQRAQLVHGRLLRDAPLQLVARLALARWRVRPARRIGRGRRRRAGDPPGLIEAISRAPQTRWPTRIGTATRSVRSAAAGCGPCAAGGARPRRCGTRSTRRAIPTGRPRADVERRVRDVRVPADDLAIAVVAEPDDATGVRAEQPRHLTRDERRHLGGSVRAATNSATCCSASALATSRRTSSSAATRCRHVFGDARRTPNPAASTRRTPRLATTRSSPVSRCTMRYCSDPRASSVATNRSQAARRAPGRRDGRPRASRGLPLAARLAGELAASGRS